MTEIEIFVLIDENGDFVVGTDESELNNQHDNDIGGNDGSLAMRKIVVKLSVLTPKAVTVSAIVPDEASAATISAK